MELKYSPEIAALFRDLKSRARAILQNRALEGLFMKMHEKKLPKRARSSSETTRASFQELLLAHAPEVPDIASLRVALRVTRQNHNIMPVPTEAIRDNDPHHHFRPIKVRDLLKESDDILKDPKQSFVDDLMEGFDQLGRYGSTEPWSPEYLPGSYLDHGRGPHSARDLATQRLSTSLNPSHASLRASQQDTDRASIGSESTVQDDVDIHGTDHVKAGLLAEQVQNDWHDVLRGKGCKRRGRSDDSQNTRRHSGHGGRKHPRFDSGRESPNRFGPLTDEPAALA